MLVSPLSNSNYPLAQKLLDAAALRQEAIATNLANAETPGFRRVDVSTDFAATLRAQLAPGGPGLRGADFAGLSPRLAEDPGAAAARPDGNNVVVQNELLHQARNASEYEYLAQLVGGHIKSLRVAITGRSA